MNKKTVKKNIISIALFICCSLFMNGFYKCLLGFVANKFSDPIIMITMLLAYLLPVFCFLVYFYNYYVKKISKIVNIIYSVIVIVISFIILVLIMINLRVYVSNNSLGVYDSIPSIIVAFPYDGIIVCITLILAQAYNLSVIIKPNHRFSSLKENHYSLGFVKLNSVEYIFMSILAILSLFTVGDFICGLNAIRNALYNPKYIYLLLWLLIIPTMNLVSFVFKFEDIIKLKLYKTIYLSSLMIVNIIFGLLLVIFEIIDPSFVVAVGKPLFPIAFSISFPVEVAVLIGIGILSVIIDMVKMILLLVKKQQELAKI